MGYARGLNKQQKDSKNTPLHVAARGDHEKIAELLIKKNANVNAQNIDGNTPLHIAASLCSRNSIAILLANGANKDLLNNAKQTPAEMTDDTSSKTLIMNYKAAEEKKEEEKKEERAKKPLPSINPNSISPQYGPQVDKTLPHNPATVRFDSLNPNGDCSLSGASGGNPSADMRGCAADMHGRAADFSARLDTRPDTVYSYNSSVPRNNCSDISRSTATSSGISRPNADYSSETDKLNEEGCLKDEEGCLKDKEEQKNWFVENKGTCLFLVVATGTIISALFKSNRKRISNVISNAMNWFRKKSDRTKKAKAASQKTMA